MLGIFGQFCLAPHLFSLRRTNDSDLGQEPPAAVTPGLADLALASESDSVRVLGEDASADVLKPLKPESDPKGFCDRGQALQPGPPSACFAQRALPRR